MQLRYSRLAMRERYASTQFISSYFVALTKLYFERENLFLNAQTVRKYPNCNSE
jgi:hypothetical protein